LGSKNAPVTIFEFGDFQCPNCGNWFKTQEQQVVQNLINTGKASLVWRDFDYYGPDSTRASEAAYAAGEQGKFWEFHDLLYANQGNPNDGWASQSNLQKFAQSLGLNMTEFNQSLSCGKYLSLINSNYNSGQQLGVSGTPTFFLVGPHGKVAMIVGTQPYSVFETQVNGLIGS
jgi:protein-disulfide isomerase